MALGSGPGGVGGGLTWRCVLGRWRWIIVCAQGSEPFSFSAALHSYLACSDCDAVSVAGNFAGATLVDKLKGGQESVEERSSIQLDSSAYDRLYRGVTGVLQLT
jgi:D-hexose-6-phosphate mutarotase